MTIGASTCRAVSAFQYAVATPSHKVRGIMIDASSSQEPKYSVLFADAAGAEVDAVAVAGETVAAAAAAAPGFEDFLACPGALSLLP